MVVPTLKKITKIFIDSRKKHIMEAVEVEVLGGGTPTLLHTSEFLFVETRLVELHRLCHLLTRGDR